MFQTGLLTYILVINPAEDYQKLDNVKYRM